MAGGLGSIVNTLQGLDPLTLAQALADQQAQELAANTQQATQAASQAQGQYQQAAQAPEPMLNPFEQLIPALFGNVASVLSQNPMYQKQGQEEVQMSRASLLKARADNLSGLMQNAKTRADAAQKAGDLESEAKIKMSLESLHQKYDTVKQSADHAFDAEQKQKDREGDLAMQALRNAGGLAEARVNAEGRMRDKAAADIEATDAELGARTFTTAPNLSGESHQFVSLSGMTGKAKTALSLAAAVAHIPALDTQDVTSVQDVDRARRDMRSMSAYIDELLPADPATRAANWANYAQQKWLQTDSARAAFKTWRDTAIPTLRGLAGSRGLRISMQQIRVMIDNLPKQNDTIATATNKFNIIHTLLDNAEAPLLTRNWTPGGAAAGDPRTLAIRAARTGDVATLKDILSKNRALDNDPTVNALVDSLLARNKPKRSR